MANGYMGRILRVDLTNEIVTKEALSQDTLRMWIGGTGLGALYLYQEVPPQVTWSDPDNRMIWASGPLGGTKVSGTGTFSIVTKGPMTDFAVATQASGFLGAFLKFSGFDAIIFQGAAPRWSYLYIHDAGAELRDAKHLVGKDTWELGETLSRELGLKLRSRVSIFGIGPAGENRVRYAAIVGDEGHVAAHNGVGAVMGSKRLKAVAVARGSNRIPLNDPHKLSDLSKRLFEHASTEFAGGAIHKLGTGGLVTPYHATGLLPVRNYTTNIFPEHKQISGQYMRTHFEVRPAPCWACRVSHLRHIKVTEGPYAGVEGEEPEYEAIAGMGSNIGVTDAGAVVMLSNLADRLGLDVNESSWTMSWLMECFEKGLVGTDDLDGIVPAWGDGDAVMALLQKIALREGCGDWLADGVMRASRLLGAEAADVGIFTLKGASPRGHDHRARWYEMLDTCLSNTSTIETSFGLPPPLPGKPTLRNQFSPEEVSTLNAATGGWRQFEDSLGVCRFCSTDPVLVLDCVKAATGWDLTVDEALDIGLRVINLLRLFNLRHGLDVALEAPSARYSSTPVDGPVEGRGIADHFDWMKRNYWRLMGWDEETGEPLPETLRQLGLESFIVDED
jgi:aldehyde:ferredoxin oxidoreductase